MNYYVPPFRLIYIALITSIAWCQTPFAEESDEYAVKAEYLYNLTKFVTWPQPVATATINICVHGKNPFGPHLDQLTSKKAKGLPIAIKYQSNDPAQDLAHELCHITFFSHHDSTSLNHFHSNAKPAQLLVGENDAFIDRGGLISLISIHNNVRLHINLTAAKQLGFKISGNLLEISATIK